uniref:Uncharacterized protein n=1 Tax=Lotharella globosa TaxID=91324 RepID=A0A7S3ZGS3_9EUKA
MYLLLLATFLTPSRPNPTSRWQPIQLRPILSPLPVRGRRAVAGDRLLLRPPQTNPRNLDDAKATLGEPTDTFTRAFEVPKDTEWRRHGHRKNTGKPVVDMVVSAVGIEESPEGVVRLVHLLDDVVTTGSHLYKLNITVLTRPKKRSMLKAFFKALSKNKGKSKPGMPEILSRFSDAVPDATLSFRNARRIGKSTVETWDLCGKGMAKMKEGKVTCYSTGAHDNADHGHADYDIQNPRVDTHRIRAFVDARNGATGFGSVFPVLQAIQDGNPMAVGVMNVENRKRTPFLLRRLFPGLYEKTGSCFPVVFALDSRHHYLKMPAMAKSSFLPLALTLDHLMRNETVTLAMVEGKSMSPSIWARVRLARALISIRLLSYFAPRAQLLSSRPPSKPVDYTEEEDVVDRAFKVGKWILTQRFIMRNVVSPAFRLIKRVVPFFKVKSPIRTGFLVRTQVSVEVEENLPGFKSSLEALTRFSLSKMTKPQLVGVMAMAISELLAREVEMQLERMPDDVKLKTYDLIEQGVVAFEAKVLEMAEQGYAMDLFFNNEWSLLSQAMNVSKSQEELQQEITLALFTYVKEIVDGVVDGVEAGVVKAVKDVYYTNEGKQLEPDSGLLKLQQEVSRPFFVAG